MTHQHGIQRGPKTVYIHGWRISNEIRIREHFWRSIVQRVARLVLPALKAIIVTVGKEYEINMEIMRFRPIALPCAAKIDQFDSPILSVLEHYVLRFQVTVYKVLGVYVPHSHDQLQKDLPTRILIHADRCGQLRAGQVLHNDPCLALFPERSMVAYDILVIGRVESARDQRVDLGGAELG